MSQKTRTHYYANRFLTGLLVFVLPFAVGASPGDDLVITGVIVNLRKQPTTEAEILLKLARDRRVVEIKREGDWVEIYTERDDISIGWVHGSLVAPVPDNHTAVVNHSGSYHRFIESFNKLNEDWKLLDCSLPFVKVDEYTNNRIRIIATSAWLQTDQTQREQAVAALFKLWGQAVGSGLSAEVVVVDATGEPYMSMFR